MFYHLLHIFIQILAKNANTFEYFEIYVQVQLLNRRSDFHLFQWIRSDGDFVQILLGSKNGKFVFQLLYFFLYEFTGFKFLKNSAILTKLCLKVQNYYLCL